MLASHDVSAGRVVTRMQFDTKYPVPRLLFSAVGPVPNEKLNTIVEKAKSAAAEAAIKLTVYQVDSADEAPAPAEAFSEVAEPVVRNEAPSEVAEQTDVSDIVRKWSKKK
jgi:hypothetical protein